MDFYFDPVTGVLYVNVTTTGSSSSIFLSQEFEPALPNGGDQKDLEELERMFQLSDPRQ